MPRLLTATLTYKKVGVDNFGNDIFRPIVLVEINKFHKDGSESSERTEVLIDSGADICMFSGEFGELLGIDVLKGPLYEFQGVGGKLLKGYRHKVGITLSPLPTVTADAVFSYELNDANTGILGQMCFFDHFSVNFRYKQKEIIIKNR